MIEELPLVVLDIDGVLADFEGASVQHFGPCDRSIYSLEERYPNLPKSVIADFVNDPLVYASLAPTPGAAAACRRIVAAGARIAYVTARPAVAYDITLEWLGRHNFPIVPLFLPHWEDKAALIADLGAAIAIDDSPRVIVSLRKLGVQTIVFNQLWNQDVGGLYIENWE